MGKLATFGRNTPPAVFTVILGLFGLTLAWRAGAQVSVVPVEISQMLLGAVVALFAIAALSYLVKTLRRPSAVIEDMRILPGRGGLAALAVSFSALAAGLVPMAPDTAAAMMYFALAFHALLTVLVVYVLGSGPAEQRRVTPLWHLSFVGFIVAAVSATALGYYGLAQTIFWATVVVAFLIWGASAAQLVKTLPPAPLRPMLAIHLAPACLFGIVALGFPPEQFPLMPVAAKAAAYVAALILLALLVNLKWIMEAGFTPLWGAFTFPMTAAAVFFLTLANQTGGLLPKIIGVALLVGATFFVPWVAMKVIQMWMKGSLATKTNASAA